MNSSRIANAVLFSALLAGALWLLMPVDRPMPQVTFTLTDGSTIDSSELRGKSVLLTFWSVSCDICLRDMPRLSAIHDSLKDQQFTVIGVAMPHDPPAAIMATVDKLAPSYPIALDVQGDINRAFGDIRVTPTTFLIRPDGNIALNERGALNETRMRATLLTFKR